MIPLHKKIHMLIHVKYSEKSRGKNKIFLVKDAKGLDQLSLNKAQKNYFKEILKEQPFASENVGGVFAVVVYTAALKTNLEEDALRNKGHEVYEFLKARIKDVTIIGENAHAVELFSEGLSLSSYSFEKYKSEKKKAKTTLQSVSTSNKKAKLTEINSIVDATVWARELINEPLSFLTAKQLAEEIKNKCIPAGIKVEVFNKQKIQSLKMGGLLAVNQGSIDPPTFTIMEWKPKNARNKKPIVLVGKGIVYDTGGLSLKPTANSMDFMKSDMGGAAAMVATTFAAAKLHLPLHIITLIPATDNRPGGNAYAPGDVITMFDGTTVEVLNTDAEGRLVLADALSYAKKYQPELVIDAATLTGAAAHAIGSFGIVAMGNAGNKEMKALDKAGHKVHDRIVEFPFWDDYKKELESPIADLKNLGGPAAGMITAGKFLEHFTDYPYIHLDIAGPAFSHKKDGYRGQGGTGAGVRLLVEFLKNKVH
jgi:leucyl aminopeptidase